jgi:hypothetical protein
MKKLKVTEVVLRKERACQPAVGRFVRRKEGRRQVAEYRSSEERGMIVLEMGLDVVSVEE